MNEEIRDVKSKMQVWEDRFLRFIHAYMRVIDRIRSKKHWLPTDYQGTPHIITPKFARSKEVVQLDDKRFVHDKSPDNFTKCLDIGFALVGLLPIIIVGMMGVYAVLSEFNYNPVFYSLFWLVSRICGDTQVRATCQVHDIGRFPDI